MNSLESLAWIVPLALAIIAGIFFAPFYGAYVLIRKAQRQRDRIEGTEEWSTDDRRQKKNWTPLIVLIVVAGFVLMVGGVQVLFFLFQLSSIRG
jgi:H+/gluconate symporter-like permease